MYTNTYHTCNIMIICVTPSVTGQRIINNGNYLFYGSQNALAVSRYVRSNDCPVFILMA